MSATSNATRTEIMARGADRVLDTIEACFAGGIMAAGGKPHTVEDEIGVFRGVRDAFVLT